MNSDINQPLDSKAYISFDALTLRNHIVERLNKSGLFTDQNYVGSNLSCFIDIVAMAYHSLLFYLNQTGSESMFTESQIYENMNRIVKLIDYKPLGSQTSTLAFGVSADTLLEGIYTIPRYSVLRVQNIPFSFTQDITFTKTLDSVMETLTDISNNHLLFQGRYVEHRPLISTGQVNEIFYLVPTDPNAIIDHFNIDVYVQDRESGKWNQYQRSNNLFLERANTRVFELRLNENNRYEIQFGDDIHGKKLKEGDIVQIYYLQSSGREGEIGPNSINNGNFLLFQTQQFEDILYGVNGIIPDTSSYLDQSQLSSFFFSNNDSSTSFTPLESVDQIRHNAPKAFRSQYRLVTLEDFDSYINSNFGNIIQQAKCLNNNQFLGQYLKYYWDLGITNPLQASRPLYNQIQFGDSCNFNNIYVIAIPRNSQNRLQFLSSSQKQFILSTLNDVKMATSEIVFVDPIFNAWALGYPNSEESVNSFDVDGHVNCQLVLVKSPNSRKENNSIRSQVIEIIRSYFDKASLGQFLSIKDITNQILSLSDVESFYMSRVDDPNTRYNGLTFYSWNEVYKSIDRQVIFGDVTLPNFKLPYLIDLDILQNKIVISDPNANAFKAPQF